MCSTRYASKQDTFKAARDQGSNAKECFQAEIHHGMTMGNSYPTSHLSLALLYKLLQKKKL